MPDFCWLLDRADSPDIRRCGYSGRQSDYGEVLDRVRSKLLALIPAK
jgi:hypothetical protein